MELYHRIKARRLELGMTQEELAAKMKYRSKTSISKIELGEADIPQSKIMDFAKALDTTPAFLMGWVDNPKPEYNRTDTNVAPVLYRLGPDVISAEQNRDLRNFAASLMDKPASLFSEDPAFQAAHKVLVENSVVSYPVDIRSLLAKYNARLTTTQELQEYYRQSQTNSEPITVTEACTLSLGDDGYLVIINARRNKSRVRFSLAHELGHIILGHWSTPDRSFRDYDHQERMEHEADRFAGFLLSPPILLNAVLEANDCDPEDPVVLKSALTTVFGISSVAADYHAIPDFIDWKKSHKPTEEEIALLQKCRDSDADFLSSTIIASGTASQAE